MPYTVVPFEADQHRPEPFLGERVELPELEGWSPRQRRLWKNPILSFEQADEFMELSGWFAVGYDKHLSPSHWGVFTARTLEAMFFRLADMAQDTPRWGHKEDGNISRLQVHCESRSMHNMARDLVVSLFHPPGTDPTNEDYIGQAENPPADREYLTHQDEGNARVRAFWAPLEVPMVINALAAWDAMRFTNHKDAAGKPRRFAVDVDLLRREGPIVAMGALFGSAFQARVQALALSGASPEPSTTAQASPRL